MSRFGSIESRHGVDEPGYEVPVEAADTIADAGEDYPHTLTYPEVLAALVLPVLGVAVAVWRFGRGDVGPGIANLLLAALATTVWAAVLLAT